VIDTAKDQGFTCDSCFLVPPTVSSVREATGVPWPLTFASFPNPTAQVRTWRLYCQVREQGAGSTTPNHRRIPATSGYKNDTADIGKTRPGAFRSRNCAIVLCQWVTWLSMSNPK
jgi:hypothetical protein